MNSQLVNRLSKIPSISGIPENELFWLVENGKFGTYEPGFVIGPKGKPIEFMWIILSGNISISVDRGLGPHHVTEWKEGEVSGMLPYSRMSAPPGDNYIKEKSEILSIPVKIFPEMIMNCPAFTAHTVHCMVDRARSFNTSEFQELDKLKSRFFANISHEFRTPLTIILGLLDNFQNKKNKEAENDIEVMRRNAHQLLDLINQLLELSKFEAGSAKLKAGPHDLANYLLKITNSFVSIAETKSIVLSLDDKGMNTAKKHEVFFEESKFEKVIFNLLSNALKFTPENGYIKVALNTTDDSAIFSVSNSGPGISEENLPYIFDRFFQADSSSTRDYEGTGIGLSLVKEIVALHHGSISVSSKPNEETKFTIKLPLGSSHLKDDEIDYNTETFNPQINVDNFITDNLTEETLSESNTLVLVIEDHADLRKYICDQLKNEYKVLEADNGADGLAKAEQEIPDIIISDVMMPKMDGYELCNSIKSNEKTNHIPVILLTAKASTENKLEGLETGADDYLVKPFNPEELKVRVRNLIKSRQELRKKFSAEMLLRPSDITVPSTQKVFLDKLTSTIESHLEDENFNVEIIGREIGMSRTQIHRKLKAITNQSATEFIRTFRLHRAAQLIDQDAGSFAEIAYQVGFKTQAYFCTSFQELFGCSPTEYKKRSAQN